MEIPPVSVEYTEKGKYETIAGFKTCKSPTVLDLSLISPTQKTPAPIQMSLAPQTRPAQ